MNLQKKILLLFLFCPAFFLKAGAKLIADPGKDTAASHKFRNLQQKGDIQLTKRMHKEFLVTAKQMMELSNKIKDPGLIAESLYALAVGKSKLGDWDLAAEHIIQALKISEPLRQVKHSAKYYFFLSDIFFELREGDKSLYYSTKGYHLLKNSKDGEAIDHRLKIMLYEILSNQLGLALRHLQEAEKYIDKKSDPVSAGKIYLYQSHTYFKKRQYAHSLQQLRKVPPLLTGNTRPFKILKLHSELAMAQTYIELRNYEQASYYLERNLKQAELQMDANDVRAVYLMGSKINEGLGHYLNAFKYLKKYTTFSDSVNNLSMKKAIHETEIKYETTLKEKVLWEQKLQLVNKDYELQKKNRYIILGAFAIIVLLLSLLIIYLVYRNKNQSVELSLLKAQIHPHFLFNTLNNLYALSISKSDEAPEVVLGLANILRYILYECNSLRVSLEKEMEVIEQYIGLEKIRYADDLEVNTYIQGSLEGYTIAPLLLLPLVENAYKHGAGKLEKDSWINIEAKIRGDRFLFKIANNKPLSKTPEAPKTEYGNIGLKNIKKRLDILYPKGHQCKITDSEDVFVVALELAVKRSF